MDNKNTNKKMDRRTRYTRQVIKDSLLRELHKKPFSKITVTEICKVSDINRGTFYLHYYDVDDLLDDVLTDALADTSDVFNHVLCPSKLDCTYPLCEKIQNSSYYQILFFDDIASARLMDKLIESHKEPFITRLMQHSILTFEQAEAVFIFQINGCLAINKMMLKNECTDWKKIQKTIDDFIKSGLEKLLISDRYENI